MTLRRPPSGLSKSARPGYASGAPGAGMDPQSDPLDASPLRLLLKDADAAVAHGNIDSLNEERQA